MQFVRPWGHPAHDCCSIVVVVSVIGEDRFIDVVVVVLAGHDDQKVKILLWS